MDLDLSEEQQVLKDMVRGLCNDACPVELVRRMEDDPKGVPDALWKQLGELGLLGVLIPEAHGGSGQSLVEAAIVHEELGRALAPTPAFVSSIVSASLLLAAGSAAQQAEWLPRIASGDAILTPAWLEPKRGFGAKGITLEARPEGDAFVLRGSKRQVAYASAAARLVVLARTGPGAEEIGLFLVDPTAPGVTLRQTKHLAADTQYDVELDGVAVAESEVLGAPGAGWATWDAVLLDAAVILAAQAIGGTDRALEITVAYAKERKQFDKPLGAFQSLSHYMADALTKIDGGRTLVYEAAWSRAQGRDVGRLAPMAKLFACDSFRDTTAACQQIWGGVGFTVEYDVQLYFRRAKQLQLTWWDPRTLEERIAAHVLED